MRIEQIETALREGIPFEIATVGGDMHGNTFEWCRDWYRSKLPGGVDPDLHESLDSAAKKQRGDTSRVRGGGCWADEGWPCRSAFRLRFEPERRYDHIGFRVAAVEISNP